MLNVSTGSQPHTLQTPGFNTSHPDRLHKYPGMNIQNPISTKLPLRNARFTVPKKGDPKRGIRRGIRRKGHYLRYFSVTSGKNHPFRIPLWATVIVL